MILPKRGIYLCEALSRERVLPSGIILPDKIKNEKNDTVCRCLGVGAPAVKDCYLCHDKNACQLKRKHKYCADHGKMLPIIARRGDIIHFKRSFGVRMTYEGRKYIFLRHQDIICIEREEKIIAVGSMVIIKLKYAEAVGKIFVPDSAQLYSGDYWGEVISVGPEYPDKNLKQGDKLIYLRNEGYKFRGYHDKQEYYAIKEMWCDGRYDNGG